MRLHNHRTRTQKDRVITLLSTGRRYSKLDLILKGCGTKPDSRISELRAERHPIKDTWVRSRNARFKVYFLPKSALRKH